MENDDHPVRLHDRTSRRQRLISAISKPEWNLRFARNGPVKEMTARHRKPLRRMVTWTVLSGVMSAATPLAIGQFFAAVGQIAAGTVGVVSTTGLLASATGLGTIVSQYLGIYSIDRASKSSLEVGRNLKAEMSSRFVDAEREFADAGWRKRHDPRSRWNIDIPAVAELFNNTRRNLLDIGLQIVAAISLVALVPLTAGGSLLFPTLTMLGAMMVPNAIAVHIGRKRLAHQNELGEMTVAAQSDRDNARERMTQESSLELRRQQGVADADDRSMTEQIDDYKAAESSRQAFGLRTFVKMNNLTITGSVGIIASLLGFVASGFPVNPGMLAAAATMLTSQRSLANSLQQMPGFLDRQLAGMRAWGRLDRALLDRGRMAGRENAKPFRPERLVIHLDGVGQSFARLDHVNAAVSDEPGFVIFDGVNGTGKSTIARIISGVDTPDFGRVYYEDVTSGEIVDTRTMRPDDISTPIGYVAQNPYIDTSLTVRQQLTLLAKRPVSDSELRRYLLEVEVDLDLDSVSDQRSGGERAVLAVGAQLFGPKRILVLDEVDGPLSRRTREALIDRIRRESAVRKIILVSHHLEGDQGVPTLKVGLNRYLNDRHISRPGYIHGEVPQEPSVFQEFSRREAPIGLPAPLQDDTIWQGRRVVRTEHCKPLGIALLVGDAPPPHESARHWGTKRANQRMPSVSGEELSLYLVERMESHTRHRTPDWAPTFAPTDGKPGASSHDLALMYSELQNAIEDHPGKTITVVPAHAQTLDNPLMGPLFRSHRLNGTVQLERDSYVEL